MKPRTIVLAVIAILALAVLAAELPEGAIQIHARDIVWQEAQPPLPKGAKRAILEGDPTGKSCPAATTCLYTMRLDLPAGAMLPPHWHPKAERGTVISGLVQVGFGDTFDDKALHSFGPGDYYVNPPNSHHFVRFAKNTIVQITGEAPWEAHLVK